MNIINLPSRQFQNRLIPVRQDETFNVYYIDTEIKIAGHSIFTIHYNDDNSIYAIDPDSGPFMAIGYEINNMILDHIDKNCNLYFKRNEDSST